jgi:outer membrane protein OmpA-like peptidoglycan-associated protein
VRIGTLEGLITETDSRGRFHLTGIVPGSIRGSTFYMKVDPATLPPGTQFTTENPRLRRITPGLPVRFDFGVELPEGAFPDSETRTEIELGELLFAPGSAEIESRYLPLLDEITQRISSFDEARLVIVATSEQETLAFNRALAVEQALRERLAGQAQTRFSIDVTTSLLPDATAVSVSDNITLNTILFDTDRAEISEAYRPLIAEIARTLQNGEHSGIVISGHADERASDTYNMQLSESRARAVATAITSELDPEFRELVTLEVTRESAESISIDVIRDGERP